MAVTRRRFIQNGLSFVSLGMAMPALLMEAATAAPTAGAGARRDRILVVIEMAGGNDGLNTVIPFKDLQYAKLRPNIGIAAGDVVEIGQGLGLNPGMAALGAMFEKGQAAVVNGVGYPNPNRSHFESMDIWQTGDPEIKGERTGWIARQFDADGHLKSNPLSGVALGSTLPLAMWSPASPVSVVGNGHDYGFDTNGVDAPARAATLQDLYAQGTLANSNTEFIHNIGQEVYASTDAIKTALRSGDDKAVAAAAYPNNNGLAERLRTIARMIGGDLDTRVYYANIGGFDTHANQPGQHRYLLSQLSEAIAAFYRDLTLRGRDKDVLLMTFSEFGRRVQENGSNGTDHGAASVMFLAGGAIKGGVQSPYPSLADLDDGDLRFNTDFRRVYATILDRWLNVPAEKVLHGRFDPLKFV